MVAPNRNPRFEHQEEQGVYDQVKHQAQDIYDQTEDLVTSHPASSALVTFGVGFGLGLMLTALMTPHHRRRHHWSEDYLPDWISRDQVADAISKMVPESLRRQLS